MKEAAHSNAFSNKAGLMALLVTVGIVFGDIGTSPLYVMKAITGVNPAYDANYIIGAVSCIIWTLTLQTTLKYVIIALQADNKGEGGILALYSLLKNLRHKWLFVPAIIGASMLIADGVITPAVTVTSAIEGLENFSAGIPVIPIVLIIIALIFLIQPFGTGSIGKFFGPFMMAWFLMLGILGIINLSESYSILKAFNPYYAINLLLHHPAWFLILGAVFLCTTGAEALYSDLGHCGKRNITVSWGFVKVMLILNYLGQGAWLLTMEGNYHRGVNPFYAIMPDWFLIFGIIMSTGAAIIASQALLSGSFTIFSEAISLNFWPRIKIKYPGSSKGQLYIPLINLFLFIGCIVTVLLFQNSSNMEAAYGLAITLTMLTTTLLLGFWMKFKGVKTWISVSFMAVFIFIEGIFLVSNAAKFMHGGWYTIMLAAIIFAIMFVWQKAVKIRNKFIEYRKYDDHLDIISDISKDKEIPLHASNLVYISKSDNPKEVESKIMYSIINKHPKRADHYFMIRVNYDDTPHKLEYRYEVLIPETLISIDLYLGYKIEPKVSVYLRQIIEDMIEKGELDLTSNYPSLKKRNIPGDFRFIIIHRLFSPSSNCRPFEKLVMQLYGILSKMGITTEKALSLDTSNVTVENVPLIITRGTNRRISLARLS
ncbi:MAG: KUP/HAK/KT family potassium transporter [Muribaculaceae bacterium]|nr:KUP/HAK/KT family potassium transporter [Muribaculaceae bacterium]